MKSVIGRDKTGSTDRLHRDVLFSFLFLTSRSRSVEH